VTAHRLLIVVVLVAAVSGCTSIEVEGSPVNCHMTDFAVCESVAALALNNLAWNRPDKPTGVVTVFTRATCPAVPAWADGTRCWQALIPLGDQESACMVIARRPELGGYGQVAGDSFGGFPRPDARKGCP